LVAQSLRSIGEAVIITDLEGKIIFVNEAFTRLHGWSENEVLGEDVTLFPSRSTPPELLTHIATETRRTGWQGELRARRKSGEEFPVLLTTAPVLNDEGELVALVGISRDLSQEKQLHAQLIQAEKLSTIGQLAAGVAHEINNPLTVMLGYSSLALQQQQLSKELRDNLETIRVEAERAAKIVRDLLAFARPTPDEKRPVDLNEVLRLTLDLQSYHLATDKIRVIWKLTEPLPKTLADLSQLQQVILNLILNAHQAMKAAHDGGTLWIETGSEDDQVWAKIQDDGPGIAPDLLSRIFDPFLTTKPVGQGTGLGLSISYGIIKAHGGHLHVESEAGRGAAFTIVLPVVQQAASVEPRAIELAQTVVRPLSVLVIDDEPQVAEVLAQMLEEIGHSAEVVCSGAEALSRLTQRGYDLVTLDLKMPQISGQQIWEWLQTADLPSRPDILFVTGDIASQEAGAFLNRPGQLLLEKPFQLDDLVRKISELQRQNASASLLENRIRDRGDVGVDALEIREDIQVDL
jgi:two-component system NtrC family sensor kinase